MTTKRALLSVSDKTGIADFGKALVERGFQLLSTGGTARALQEAGLPVTKVSEITRHPEIMDGRVKTLHPAIHGPLLARRDRDGDLAALAEHDYGLIDVVAVNLYPFRQTVAGGGVDVASAMEKVDIGGPTMIRAAAKNHRFVWIVVDPSDYESVLTALDGVGEGEEQALRRDLAAKVFRHISAYDAAVAAYLESQGERRPDPLPDDLADGLEKVQSLRYGENPDQAAAFYAPSGLPRVGLSGLDQHHGKELSYNNILDLDGALLSLSPFAFSSRPAVAIIKHTTPCGLGVGDTLAEAYERALATDPVSAFGSVIAVNRPVDAATAELMSALFIECIVAPAFAPDAMEILTAKKNLRLLTFPVGTVSAEDLSVDLPDDGWWTSASDEAREAALYIAAHGRLPDPRVVRTVYGGALAQTPPNPPFYGLHDPSWKVVTSRDPSESEMDDLRFAWGAVYGVKSNAILLAREGGVVGVGAGQMSRVDSSRLAVQKASDAGLSTQGAVLASDAFFPFRDGIDAAAGAGIVAVIQPGGSIRDEEVIKAADEHGMAMVFTGRRLFRH
jgi:phosphoribosylaminoimidazolecarboxamide formyltransferase/IMP cyclohydrolase